MKILILSRLYWPDTNAVAQLLGDLSFSLAEEGHEVDVWTSRFAYDLPGPPYPSRELKEGVRIKRFHHFPAHHGHKILRGLDFMYFNFLIFFRLLFLPPKKYDKIIGLTNPPLLSFFGIWLAKRKKIPFVYWTMDLQPELSIQAGYFSRGSKVARAFSFMGDYIFRHADQILTLDHYMASHIAQRGAHPDRIITLPLWPAVLEDYTGNRLENPFRIKQGFADKIVVMYSGNHSVIHPLNTLLEAAKLLKEDEAFLFVFIGEGGRKKEVTEFKNLHQLSNIVQLPYQPREEIHFSLGSADIQVVVMGDGFVGYTHPNKIYGALFLQKPIMYIGPTPSHITEILEDRPGNIVINHGNYEGLAQQLIEFKRGGEKQWQDIGWFNRNFAEKNFSKTKLIKKYVKSLSEAPKSFNQEAKMTVDQTS
ncbi:MAG: glycosyltransferase family 4 protein [Bacteroidota bacterium]